MCVGSHKLSDDSTTAARFCFPLHYLKQACVWRYVLSCDMLATEPHPLASLYNGRIESVKVPSGNVVGFTKTSEVAELFLQQDRT